MQKMLSFTENVIFLYSHFLTLLEFTWAKLKLNWKYRPSTEINVALLKIRVLIEKKCRNFLAQKLQLNKP